MSIYLAITPPALKNKLKWDKMADAAADYSVCVGLC
jgi:hypothetical protein